MPCPIALSVIGPVQVSTQPPPEVLHVPGDVVDFFTDGIVTVVAFGQPPERGLRSGASGR
jgi:hypothetical protein